MTDSKAMLAECLQEIDKPFSIQRDHDDVYHVMMFARGIHGYGKNKRFSVAMHAAELDLDRRCGELDYQHTVDSMVMGTRNL